MSAIRLIRIKVKVNARASQLIPPDEQGLWQAQLKSPPVDGRANRELIMLVAKHFGCPRSAVTITAGMKARLKRLRINCTS